MLSDTEIATVETPERRKLAGSCAKPKVLAPASAPTAPQSPEPIGQAETSAWRRAKRCAKPIDHPPVALIGNATSEAGGDGQLGRETHSSIAIAATVAELVSLQRRRRFCIVSQSRIDRSMESLIASTVGFRIDAEESDRKKVFARAKAIRLDVEKGGDGQNVEGTHHGIAISSLAPLILTSANNRKQWDDLRTEAEKEMRRLAKSLPIYDFAKGVKGFGDLGLAIICAEAGIPIGDYRTVSGLWKRMGLAVIDGERQRKKSNVEDAAAHGYSPTRRAEVWALCSDSMFRHQWAAAKEDTPAHPTGPYGDVYARRRANTDPRMEATADLPLGDPGRWTKGRCHNDARRIMTKELLKRLWVQWRANGQAPG